MKKIKTQGIAAALLFSLAAVLITLTGSCSKERTDISDLVATVPSSAETVVGINLRTILEKSGCKVKDGKITPGKELKGFLEGIKGFNSSEKEILDIFLSGESGIDPVGAVFFTDAYGSYITAVLADTGKFMAFAETQTGKKFEDNEEGVKTLGEIAVKGAQVWISSARHISPKAMAYYSSLEKSQSFLSNPFSGKIAEMASDLIGYGQLKGLSKAMSLSEMASLNLLTGLAFDNAAAYSFTLDFDNGEAVAVASVLNDKGEPAEYLFPTDKIDIATVKGTAETASVLFAMTITKEIIEKAGKVGETLGGSSVSPLIKSLQALDGTAAVALADASQATEGISGVVTTDGNPSLDLMQLISMAGATQKEGKLVRFTKGTVSGGLDVAQAAEQMKGASLAVAISFNEGSKEAESGIESVCAAVRPDGKGIKLEIKAATTGKNENSLLSLLKSTE